MLALSKTGLSIKVLIPKTLANISNRTGLRRPWIRLWFSRQSSKSQSTGARPRCKSLLKCFLSQQVKSTSGIGIAVNPTPITIISSVLLLFKLPRKSLWCRKSEINNLTISSHFSKFRDSDLCSYASIFN